MKTTVLKLFFLCLVCGCSSKRTESLATEQSQLLSEFSQQVSVPIYALWSLSQDAILSKNYEVASRSLLLLCQNETTLKQRKIACRKASDLAIISKNDESIFIAKLNQYMFAEDSSVLPLLEAMDLSDQQHMLLETAKGQIVSADMSSYLDSSSLGQWNYLFAKQHRDIKALDKAIVYFEQTSQPAKVADSLFLQAKILWEQEDFSESLRKATEAALISDSMNRRDIAAYIRSWVDAHTYTK